jgi:hypothetical protein
MLKNRNDGEDVDVQVICPTCQNVCHGIAQTSHAGGTIYLCMGLFSIFLISGGQGRPLAPCHHASTSEMVGTLSPSAFAPRAMADAVVLRAAAEALPTLRSYLIVIPCVLNLM